MGHARLFALALAFAFLLPTALFALAPPASAETGSLNVSPGDSDERDIGTIKKGKVIEFGWTAENPADRLDFHISSGENTYGQKTNVNGSQASISVQSDMSFQMHWTCNNDYNTAFVHYWYYTVSLQVDCSFDRFVCGANESNNLTATITNTNSDQIKVIGIGIHFDWYAKGEYKVDLSLESSPKELGAGLAMTSVVPFDTKGAIDGYHLYDVIVRYDLKHDDQWTRYDWSSGSQFNFKIVSQDSDGDGTPDSQDAFPGDASEQNDSDLDGVGDNADVFPSDPGEIADLDGDGVGDNSDAFPGDPAASVDSDNDGHPDGWNAGKTGTNSTSGLKLDRYPTDASKWEEEDDTPGFGALGAVLAVGCVAVVCIVARKRK